MTDPMISLRRRQMLAGSAGALAAAGLGGLSGSAAAQASAAAPAGPRPLPPYAAWKDASSMIVHSSNTIETRRSAFGTSVITPAEKLFVRNNLPPPDASIVANRDAWQVSMEGVRNPRSVSVAELKTIGLETIATVVQCSGNGRGFFPSKPSGTPWNAGAAGCVVWSGVPVRFVAEALGGLAPGALYLTGTGGETLPAGVDPLTVVVERSLPLKALNDAILAWEMNGAPIPLAHGGPLRLIAPGYSGVNNVKYVKRVAFTSAESKARIMSHGYRMTPLGGAADPNQPSVLEMEVKSWVNHPGAERPVPAGTVYVTGVAMGSGSAVRRVEVSTDGGRSWLDAAFVGPDLGRFAWRQFAIPLRMAPGNYIVTSRATDTAGNVQLENRFENAGGYSNSSWRDHALQVTVV